MGFALLKTLKRNQSQLERATALPYRRHPLFRRLEHFFWLAGGLAAGWFVLASLGIVPFQVTQAKRLETPQQSYSPTRALQPGDPFGKISIPRIGLSSMIAEGDDEATLRNAVGHIPGTADPWGTGNIALAGNRDTFFRSLSRVRLDDVILLETRQGTYHYRVVTHHGGGSSTCGDGAQLGIGSHDRYLLSLSLRGVCPAKVYCAGHAPSERSLSHALDLLT